ncbi:MAG: hypothetical protein JSW51_03460 [Gemmatimonadota bacterium]|nr:MAG: hypothetical protein JSW51_03460 [Gemmatimonadota bacterium]
MCRPLSLVAVPMIAALAAACEPYTVTHPGEYNGGNTASPRIVTTYESWWAGQYDGSGQVRLLSTGDDYNDVSVCFELWIDQDRLRIDAYVRLLSSPLEFKEISDGTYSGGQPTGCAAGEGGVRFETSSYISEVTSQDSVVALDWGESFFGVQRHVALLLAQAAPSEFLAKIVVAREDPLCAAGALCSWIEAAKLTFDLSKTN